LAAKPGRRPAVYLLELDAIGSSSCIDKVGSMPEWAADLRYEMSALQALPHTVVCVEGGYSDSNSVAHTARILNAIGVNKIRGFFTNDTHENWTINEVRWGQKANKTTPTPLNRRGAHGRARSLRFQYVERGRADPTRPGAAVAVAASTARSAAAFKSLKERRRAARGAQR
jgi:hypothetical protein